jgi:hypothetical protein
MTVTIPVPAPDTWDVEYKQTPHERYNTSMNDTARKLIEQMVPVTGEWGGAMVSSSPDDPCADQGFSFLADEVTARRVRDALADHLGRPVELSAFTGEDSGVQL